AAAARRRSRALLRRPLEVVQGLSTRDGVSEASARRSWRLSWRAGGEPPRPCPAYARKLSALTALVKAFHAAGSKLSIPAAGALESRTSTWTPRSRTSTHWPLLPDRLDVRQTLRTMVG